MLYTTYKDSCNMFGKVGMEVINISIEALVKTDLKVKLVCGCTGKEVYAHGMCKTCYNNFEG